MFFLTSEPVSNLYISASITAIASIIVYTFSRLHSNNLFKKQNYPDLEIIDIKPCTQFLMLDYRCLSEKLPSRIIAEVKINKTKKKKEIKNFSTGKEYLRAVLPEINEMLINAYPQDFESITATDINGYGKKNMVRQKRKSLNKIILSLTLQWYAPIYKSKKLSRKYKIELRPEKVSEGVITWWSITW